MFAFVGSWLCSVVLLLGNSANGKFLGRVIGGNDAEILAHPYQASIRISGFHKCGGSLLNHLWILTAAHCLVEFDPREITVVLGSNNLMSGGDTYFPKQIRVHPLYAKSEHENDVGLIQMSRYVEFSETIGPIKLPMKDVEEKDCTANFTGWGNKEIDVVNHDVLQVIELTVIDTSVCHSIFSSVGRGHLCTLTAAGRGICYGDSGGPLVANGIQIAIASWGSPCARGYPDVHTRVYKHTHWIKSIID